MPLVAHPVRSLWGSQPRCARCVCEWLHRKWDGAVPVCTLSPTCSSDIVNSFPFSRLTLAVDGKQPFLGGGGGGGEKGSKTNIIEKKT